MRSRTGLLVAGVLGASLAATTAAGGAGTTGPGVRERLAGAPAVRVVVALWEPDGDWSDPLARGRRVADLQRQVIDRIAAGDLVVLRRFSLVPGFAAEVTTRGLDLLEAHPAVRRVDLDVPVRGHLAQSVPLIGADVVQQVQGFTGQGVLVAVLDTGIDTDHPDLSDDLVEEACFCVGCCPGGGSTQFGAGSAEDDNGHGSNVTGIITSAGTVTSPGVAPDAEILAIKVLGAGNTGLISDFIAGLDWIVANRPQVDLVNMSLGSFDLFSGDCDTIFSYNVSLSSAINALRDRGTLTFSSSGNSASGTQMSSPACIASAISVGAVYDANVGGVGFSSCVDGTTGPDQVTCFSNSNDRTDVFAPGGAITSTNNSGGVSTFYGTSQASPHGAGCAALLMEMNPGWDPDTIESALESTGVPVVDPKNLLTFPRIDCLAATGALPDLVFDGSVVSDGEKGNGNGVADPGDRFTLIVDLRNNGLLGATGISGTLSTTTPGITVLAGVASWGEIGRDGVGRSSPPHFSVEVAASVPCGQVIDFALDVSTDQTSFPMSFPLMVGTGAPASCEPVPCVITPAAQASPATICEGDSAVVSGAGSSENGSDCSGVLEFRFEQSGPVLQDWSTDPDIQVSPAVTTFYQVKVRDQSTLAEGQAFPSVEVLAAPVTAVTQAPDPMCVELGTATLDAGGGFSGYQWIDDGAQVVGSSQTLPVTDADCGRAFTAEVTGANGCSATFGRVVACVPCTPPEVSPPGAAVPFRMGLDAAATIEFELLPDPDVTYNLYHAATVAEMLAGDWTTKFCDLASGSTGTWNPIDATTVRWTPVIPGVIFEGFWIVMAEKMTVEGPYGSRSDGTPRPPDADGAGSGGSFGCP